MSKENPSRLLDELFKTVEVFGVDRTTDILKTTRERNYEFSNDDVSFVVTMVATEFQLDINEIIYGNGRKNDRIYAIGFCIHYLKNHFKYPIESIKDQLNKGNFQNCYYYLRFINDLNPKIHTHKKYLGMKSVFDAEVQKRKTV